MRKIEFRTMGEYFEDRFRKIKVLNSESTNHRDDEKSLVVQGETSWKSKKFKWTCKNGQEEVKNQVV